MKKIVKCLALLLVLIILVTPVTAFAQRPITLIVNGEVLKPDVAPYILNGRTMVPVRFIGEALGMEVSWHYDEYRDTNHVLLVDSEGKEIFIGYKGVLRDGITFDYEPDNYVAVLDLRGNRSFTPVRYIANALHMDVEWDQATRTVILTTNNKTLDYPLYYTKAHGEWNSDLHFTEEKSQHFYIQARNGKYYLKAYNPNIILTPNNLQVDEFVDYVLENLSYEKIENYEVYPHNLFFMDPERAKVVCSTGG